jgi:hypothetical protein
MAHVFEKIDTLSEKFTKPEEPSLPAGEARAAARALSLPLFKSVVRAKRDPALANQIYGLFSFTPARGVQPNKYGVFGTAKLRGNYATEEDSATAAESIVRHVDSANEIYTVLVGQEFPLTKEPRFVKDFENVDLSKNVEAAERQRIKDRRKEDKESARKMVDRERQMLEEHKQILEGTYEEDPLDVYIRANVKRSQLQYTLEITEKKIENDVKPAIAKVVAQIAAMDEQHPELRGHYKERYLEARKEAGLETEFKCDTGTQLDFMKYL